MATALFFRYVRSAGFVVASDGLSSDEETGNETGRDIQKIFPIKAPGRQLAYAVTGAIGLEAKPGHPKFDLLAMIATAVEGLSGEECRTLNAFVEHTFESLYSELKECQRGGTNCSVTAFALF